MTAVLRGAAYELGEYANPVAELDEVDALLAPEAGFDTYRCSDAEITELMADAAARTFAETGVAAKEIDAVVLATDSLPAGRRAHRAVAELLTGLGVQRAAAFTVGLMDCATAMVALTVAAGLVDAGGHRNVLVLSGDLVDQVNPQGRIVAGSGAVASDAAASALVSADGPGRPILGGAQHLSAELVQPDLPPQRQLAGRIRAHRELMAGLRGSTGLGPDDISLVLPSNFARNVIGPYLGDIQLPADKLYLANVGRIAHCLGSDPLINLADSDAEAPQGSDGPRLLFGSGISHLAAVVLGPVVPS